MIFVPPAALRLPDSLMLSGPQVSPDGVSDGMEGLTVSSKYKRVWVKPLPPLMSLMWLQDQSLTVTPLVLRSFDKKVAPVSMSKLLSHGYVEEKKTPTDDEASST